MLNCSVEILDNPPDTGAVAPTTAPAPVSTPATAPVTNKSKVTLEPTGSIDKTKSDGIKKEKSYLSTEYIVDGDAQVVLNVSK